jgi:hypothetical protein
LSKADELKSYLPTYYNDSNEMNAICDTNGAEFDDIIFDVEDIVRQCFPQTSTWGVAYWEEFLGIPSNIDEDLSSRRAKIVTKISRTSPMTPFEMRKILKNFVDDVLISQSYEIYKFDITLITRTKIDVIMENIIKEIEDSKPAHTSYEVAIDYLTEYTIQKYFARWATEPYKICGTFDTAGNDVIAMQGKTINSSIEAIGKGYTADVFMSASSKTYSRGGVLVYDS